ncbi:MAG: hypothetical protein UR14_C0008G0056 [candidate division TM6 bacterium GW2011_GWE2_31_21]|nr:MAG: hypothetical protein UR14_C0008G0056 [candidate division TM6 bacterium GW2011_GWE2_31_21]KKP53218.1 MAG: hypothetical protein UR43_C0006G0001 [candidate division TM6 bacterium GW2011_GWF2_33_332]HBS48083.1 hypothetical protein [Candidatus Dependentiae bacterium]
MNLKTKFLIFLALIAIPIATPICTSCADYKLRIENNGQQSVKSINNEFIKTLPNAQKQNIIKTESLTLRTESGIEFPTIFINNNSSHILVLGQGFPGGKESMKSFIDYLGSDFDYIIFDYRWTQIFKFMCKPSTLIHPFQKLLCEEQEELFAIAKYIRLKERERNRTYKERIALGECYSNFVFVKSQVLSQQQGNAIFTKLILDSCWLSLKDFVDSICFDPYLPCSPQEGGTPLWIKRILTLKWIHAPISKIARLLTPQISISPYLAQLENIPVLFIHGTNDLMVPRKHFDKIWEDTATHQKAAFITPHAHSDNFKKESRHLYKYLVKTFAYSNFDEFYQNVEENSD